MRQVCFFLGAFLALFPLHAGEPIISSDALFEATYEDMKVTVDGVVHSAFRTKTGGLELSVWRGISYFSVVIRDGQGIEPERLINAVIKATGQRKDVLSSSGNPIGVWIDVTDKRDLTILSPSPGKPFAQPVQTWQEITARKGVDRLRCVHIKGVVTLARTFDQFFTLIAEDGTAIRIARAHGTYPPQPGFLVDVIGFVENVSTTPRLNDARWKRIGTDLSALPQPIETSISELREKTGPDKLPSLFARHVSLEGTIESINVNGPRLYLTIRAQKGGSVPIVIPLKKSPLVPEDWQIGCRVKATGVLLYYTIKGALLIDRAEQHNLFIHTQNEDGITVLEGPPFWTVAKLWILMGLVVCGFLGWILAIWRRKTLVIRENRAVARERFRLQQDLHDNMQQILAGTMFRLEGVMCLVGVDNEKTKEEIGKARKAITNALAGLRTILWGLREENDGPQTLIGLFRYAVNRLPHWNSIVEITSQGHEPESARRLGGRLLMIMQEAVGNALKHGNPKKVLVQLKFIKNDSKPWLLMVIRDDGTGFDFRDQTTDGLGLESMRLRASEVGGSLTLASERGKGTIVKVEVPL